MQDTEERFWRLYERAKKRALRIARRYHHAWDEFPELKRFRDRHDAFAWRAFHVACTLAEVRAWGAPRTIVEERDYEVFHA